MNDRRFVLYLDWGLTWIKHIPGFVWSVDGAQSEAQQFWYLQTLKPLSLQQTSAQVSVWLLKWDPDKQLLKRSTDLSVDSRQLALEEVSVRLSSLHYSYSYINRCIASTPMQNSTLASAPIYRAALIALMQRISCIESVHTITRSFIQPLNGNERERAASLMRLNTARLSFSIIRRGAGW